MAIKQTFAAVSSDSYPATPDFSVDFDTDCWQFINQGGTDDGADTPSMVHIAFDGVRHNPDGSLIDDLSISVAGAGAAIAVNQRAKRVFLRNQDSGAGTLLQVIASKAK